MGTKGFSVIQILSDSLCIVYQNMKKNQNKRVRNWTFVLYPESAPEDWKKKLEELHIPLVISPLHDKDVDPDGVLKKPHYHILLIFDGNKSYEQVLEITKLFNAPIPQICQSVKGMIRYFTHMDNPDKYQYDRADIETMGGISIEYLLKPTLNERYEFIGEMMDWVDDNDITEIELLLKYSRKNRFFDWFPLLCDNSAYIMGEYIKSKRNRYKEEFYRGTQYVTDKRKK